MNHGKFYHVVNHANGWDNLFEDPSHYSLFLQRMVIKLSPVASVHAYCLMPNHFHLLVKIHDEEVIRQKLLENYEINELLGFNKHKKSLFKLKAIDPFYQVTQQFSNFFNSYAQIFNRLTNRKGNLFQKSFKVFEIDSLSYLLNTVRYIHYNPVHHNFTASYDEWHWSSFKDYRFEYDDFVVKEDILSAFDGASNFMDFHLNRPDKEDWDI